MNRLARLPSNSWQPFRPAHNASAAGGMFRSLPTGSESLQKANFGSLFLLGASGLARLGNKVAAVRSRGRKNHCLPVLDIPVRSGETIDLAISGDTVQPRLGQSKHLIRQVRRDGVPAR